MIYVGIYVPPGPNHWPSPNVWPQFSAGVDPLKETEEALASLRYETPAFCNIVSRRLFVILSARRVGRFCFSVSGLSFNI